MEKQKLNQMIDALKKLDVKFEGLLGAALAYGVNTDFTKIEFTKIDNGWKIKMVNNDVVEEIEIKND